MNSDVFAADMDRLLARHLAEQKGRQPKASRFYFSVNLESLSEHLAHLLRFSGLLW